MDPKTLLERCERQLQDAVSFGLDAFSPERPLLNCGEERAALGRRMTQKGANIRSARGISEALEENKEQMERIRQSGILQPSDLKHYYRLRDLLFSQNMYLEAIRDYMEHGGTSRGSYLICDETGEKPLETLPDLFCFSLEDRGLGKMVQEIHYEKGTVRCSWRLVRPIPEDDSWFEKVWRDYREERYYD